MILVRRVSAPSYLTSAEAAEWCLALCDGRAQYYRDLAAYRGIGRPPKSPHAKKVHYRNKAVYKALKSMFGPKCAYCEGKVAAFSPLHVEHYRPASRYPGLAYQWDNLLLACTLCNIKKGDQFPMEPTGYVPQENRLHPCVKTGAEESPFLLNPCVNNPEEHLTFRKGRVVALTKRGHYTRRICDLNRPDLIEVRSTQRGWIEYFALKYQIAELEGHLLERDEYADKLKLFVVDAAPFAAMARAELDLLQVPWRTW